MKFERMSERPTGGPPARRTRPSLLRLSFTRITARHQQPLRTDEVAWKGSRRSLCTKSALLLFSLLLFHFLIHHADAVLALLRDPTEPTTFFKTYRVHGKEIVLRPWTKPYIFKAFSDETKRFIRHQPIVELQLAPRPSTYECQIGDEVPLAIIGVFSTAARSSRRDLLRQYGKPAGGLVNGRRIEFKFILGRPTLESEVQSLRKEMKMYDDIILLDDDENMNNGKTFMYFQWLAKRPGPKPRFAFKVDDDTVLTLPNLVNILDRLDCNDLYYLGSCIDITCGLDRGFPYYFTGMAYGLSAPLYQWIGNSDLPRKKTKGLEDVRTAKYLLNLDKARGERLIRYNLDGRMGDFRHFRGREWEFDPRTVLAVHGMKTDRELRRLAHKLSEHD